MEVTMVQAVVVLWNRGKDITTLSNIWP